MSRYAKSRKTEAASVVESFLDSFSERDHEEGYDGVYDSLESVAEEVDTIASELEKRIEELEAEIEELKEEE